MFIDLLSTPIEFYKCQSLGNNFILFDWLDFAANKTNKILQNRQFPKLIENLCDRNFGIGADGVLIILPNAKNIEALIFNADGSNGGKCLNGLRCVANYLHEKRNTPKTLSILMGKEKIATEVLKNSEIKIALSPAKKIDKLSIKKPRLDGYTVDVGNPHFIIWQEIDWEWLAKYGLQISTHEKFPKQTNVEFVWQGQKIGKRQSYNILVFERGCGITMACGTGAAAVMNLLLKLGKINADEEIVLNMLGGEIISSINNRQVIQRAKAEIVYKGVLQK
jgi:diaminopimelate epimerase